jgi:hypothetical protein
MFVEDGEIIRRRLSVPNNEHGKKHARLNFKVHLWRASTRKILLLRNYSRDYMILNPYFYIWQICLVRVRLTTVGRNDSKDAVLE